MEITGKVTIPSREEERVIKVQCDICKREGKTTHSINESNWSNSYYEVSKTTIRYEHGSHYPECKDTKIEFFNICPDCWENALKPLMYEVGAELQKSEDDY